jgi:hypothetical protein
MPRYRIFQLKDSHLDTFRQAAPKKPPYRVKLRYYDDISAIEAVNPYAAWKALQGDEPQQDDAGNASAERIFGVGDVLESGDSTLLLCHYWGFEAAEWILPENEFNRGEIVDEDAGSEAASTLQAIPASAS